MIFVTVGTHEQPFNRLIKKIDELKGEGLIQEEVILQTGFSTYEPKHCKWQKLYAYQEMLELVSAARIVITHGGPSSFIMPLQVGKVPIVVPRKKEFGEHVNDHQVEFVKRVGVKYNNLLFVDDVDKLNNTIAHYEKLVCELCKEHCSNNEMFVKGLNRVVEDMWQNC